MTGVVGQALVDAGALIVADQLICSDWVVARGRFTLGPVSTTFCAGQLTSVIGANGSGKTTLLRSLLGLFKPETGVVSLHGTSMQGRPPSLLRQVGYAADSDEDLIGELTPVELWGLHAAAHARVSGSREDLLARAYALAEQLDYVPPRRRLDALSHGLKRKAQLVAALLHDPQVVILDEPRNGLDPIAIERIELLALAMARAGRTVIVATHDLRFAERISDKVLMLDAGRVVADGPPALFCQPGESLVDGFFRRLGAVRGAQFRSDADPLFEQHVALR